MEVLIVIPARYASSRFPGKPLAQINGKPMIQCTYEQAKKTGWEVVVATDDDRIFNAVKAFGGEVCMTSPNHVNGTLRVAEAVGIVEETEHKKYDCVVNVQGDEPFINPDDIRTPVSLIEKQKGDIATLCKRITSEEELDNPNVVKLVKSFDNKALYFSRATIPFSRDIADKDRLRENNYYKHIGLYVFDRDVLFRLIELGKTCLERAESLEQLRWLEYGYRIAIAETSRESIGIDTPEDLAQANLGCW